MRKAMRKGSLVYRILISGSRTISRSNIARNEPKSRQSVAISRFSTTTRSSAQHTHLNGETPDYSPIPTAAATTETDKIAERITKIDPYLPLELRSGSWQDNLESFEGVRSVESLPEILQASERWFPNGILTYIALEQRRWSAALYLCEAILKFDKKPTIQPLNLFEGSPWAALQAAGPPIDVDIEDVLQLWDLRLFNAPDHKIDSTSSLDYIAATPFPQQNHNSNLWHSTLGQILRCIGHVMLAGTRENSPLQIDMTGFVFQVIAAMHTYGTVSSSIYLFETGNVASSIRKSPFLHLMSSRIMTALSDTMWKKAEPDLMRDVAYVVASHAHKGKKSPAGDMGPRLKPLKHEVWMEFILWSCVHDGHFLTGMELISSMLNQEESQRWNTAPWRYLQHLLDEKLLQSKDMRKAQTWYQRLASSMEGYSEEMPLVNLPRNTISREVVMRLCDGILSVDPQKHQVTRDSAVFISDAMRILGPIDDAEDFFAKMSAGYRAAEKGIENVLSLAVIDSQHSPWSWTSKTSTNVPDTFGLLEEQLWTDQEDIYPSLQVKAIAHHVELDNVRDALESYDKLKVWSGNATEDFDGASGEHRSQSNGAIASRLIDLRFLLPTNLLAGLLDLVISSKMFETAKKLLSPFGTTTEKEAFTDIQERSSALTSATKRYLSAALEPGSMEYLWEKGYFSGEAFDRDTLQEFFFHHITKNDFEFARTILRTLIGQLDLSPDEIARLTVMILNLEVQKRTTEATELTKLLAEILSGQFNTRRSGGLQPDWTGPRRLNQLSRILASIPSPCLKTLASLRTFNDGGQAVNPIHLPISAFNTILDAVIDIYGEKSGMILMQRWCQTEAPKLQQPFRRIKQVPSRTTPRPGDRAFVPFTFNLQTLRILIKRFTNMHKMYYRPAPPWRKNKASSTRAQRIHTLYSRSKREGIIASYYPGSDPAAYLHTVLQAMHLAQAFGFHEDGTFETLLMPMEDRPVDLLGREKTNGSVEQANEPILEDEMQVDVNAIRGVNGQEDKKNAKASEEPKPQEWRVYEYKI